jgi:hypothetical protein
MKSKTRGTKTRILAGNEFRHFARLRKKTGKGTITGSFSINAIFLRINMQEQGSRARYP